MNDQAGIKDEFPRADLLYCVRVHVCVCVYVCMASFFLFFFLSLSVSPLQIKLISSTYHIGE